MVAFKIMKMSGFLPVSFALLSSTMFWSPLAQVVKGEHLRAAAGGGMTSQEMVTENFDSYYNKQRHHRDLQMAYDTFDIANYRSEFIAISITSSDVSDDNVNKAETQIYKSLEKALRLYMLSSSVFESKLQQYAGVVDFNAEDVRFESPSSSSLNSAGITVEYAMPSFYASWKWDDSSNGGSNVKEDVANALVDSLVDDSGRFEDFFADDFLNKQNNNWALESIQVN